MPVGRVPELPVSILCRAPQPRSLWGAVARSSAATVPDSRLVGGVGLELGVARRRLRRDLALGHALRIMGCVKAAVAAGGFPGVRPGVPGVLPGSARPSELSECVARA